MYKKALRSGSIIGNVITGKIAVKKLHTMEKLGDRWWPMLGGFYFLVIQKRVHGMTPIRPLWKKKLIKTPVYSPQKTKNFKIKL